MLEDDYDAEYRYDRPPVGAVQGLDLARVVYLGSVSKTLAPALRIGLARGTLPWRRPSSSRRPTTTRARPCSSNSRSRSCSSAGEVDRHVRRSPLVYRRRRDTLVEALAQQLPDARPDGIAAGLHVVLRLPDQLDDQAVVEAAGRRGIAAVSLSEHRTRPGARRSILGYGQIADAAIVAGVRELALAVRDVSSGA